MTEPSSKRKRPNSAPPKAKITTYGRFFISGVPGPFTCPLCGVTVQPLQAHECINGVSQDSQERGEPQATIGQAIAAAFSQQLGATFDAAFDPEGQRRKK